MASTDVPASVRRAFATKRLQSAWNMLSSSQVGDRSAAIEGVARILESEGLALSDVMTAVLTIPVGPYRRRSGHDGQGDLFTHSGEGAGHGSSPGMRLVSGRDVPERIGGRVIVLDERSGRKGPEMIIAVIGFDARYDPIAARTERAISQVRAAAQRGGIAQFEIETVRTARQMPCVARVGMGIVI